ncbi:MAG: hypothetical protein EA409_11585 [Saprospirales bacterium]|nr:MAG: hypothetical protein EA409_11585 [Saprospirales bacterium]
MNLRNSYCTETTVHNGGHMTKNALSIVFFLSLIITITVSSCKEECMDICLEVSLILDETSCSCVCPEKQTPFKINGYIYCFEESKTHYIYILENLNAPAWILSEVDYCSPPEIFISRVPKFVDSLESFYIEWYEDSQYSFYFEFYIQPFGNQRCRSANTRDRIIPINWLKNDFLPEIYIFGIERFFNQGAMKEIHNNLFKKTSGIGLVQLSENLDSLTFHYLGYKNLTHMHDAFYDLAPDYIFNFPYVPRDPLEMHYDPLHLQLIFSRLEF